MDKLGFVQADPIRAPARAQDLILRHRVKNYRVDELEKKYSKLPLDEDIVYAYGFVSQEVGRLVRIVDRRNLSRVEKQLLAAVDDKLLLHPRELDESFGTTRVKNAWGKDAKASKIALERLHRRGLLRVAKRDKGIRVYARASDAVDRRPAADRFRDIALASARIFAPVAVGRLVSALTPVRRRLSIDARTARSIIDQLVATGELRTTSVERVFFIYPSGFSPVTECTAAVRFLAPFDPVVWDRTRFKQFWGWDYRFEAYVPKSKRVRGQYAMPLLWRDEVIGWANIGLSEQGKLEVDLGFQQPRPSSRRFKLALDEEIDRFRSFLN